MKGGFLCGLAGTVDDIKEALPENVVLSENVFDVNEEDAASSENDITGWLEELGLKKNAQKYPDMDFWVNVNFHLEYFLTVILYLYALPAFLPAASLSERKRFPPFLLFRSTSICIPQLSVSPEAR